MILRIFKTNQLYIYAIIPMLVLALRWPVFFLDAPFTPSGQLPFFSDFFAWLSYYPWLSVILSAAAISYQAYLLSELMNEHRLLPFSSNLAAFVLTITYSFLAPHAWFSPIILSNIFVVMSLRRILSIYHQGNINGNLFRAGIFIGVGSLIYLPSSFMILILFYDLYLIRTFYWREYVIPALGFIVPYIYMLSYYYIRAESEIFLNYFIEPKTFLTFNDYGFFNWLPLEAGFLLLASSILYLILSGSRRTVRENNQFKVIIAMLIITAILCAIYSNDIMSATALLWPAASVLVTYFLLGIRKKMISEVIVYVLIIVIVLRDWLTVFSE